MIKREKLLEIFTPLLAVPVAFRAGLFNIVAEGYILSMKKEVFKWEHV